MVPDMNKTLKMMPYIGIACALISVIFLPLFFSVMAIILGAYSYYQGEKKGILPIILGLLLTIIYIESIASSYFAGTH
jgi:hypothetical protein